MTKKTRSARGEILDWDLLKIKQQIASGPTPINVEERERFIDQKTHRNINRRKTKPPVEVEVEPKIVNSDDLDDELLTDDEVANEDNVAVDPKKPRKVKKDKK